MKKAIVLLLLLSSALSACNLQQNGATAVRTPIRQPSQASQPTLADTVPPGSTAAPTLPPKSPPPTAPAPAASQAAPTQAPEGAYPASPVDVVQAFVEAYPDAIPEMERYLSKAMRAALPRGGPGELLKVQGDVNGFTVLSGSVVPDPPQALVIAAIQAGGARVERTFSLVQEKGLWVINGIQ